VLVYYDSSFRPLSPVPGCLAATVPQPLKDAAFEDQR
jgi:hypothetical protein